MFLPSNVSPRYFPGNRISSFKVKFPKRVNCRPDEFKVALTEVTYNRTFTTLLSDTARIFELRTSTDPLFDPKHPRFIFPTFKLPNINYENIFTMIDSLNQKIAAARDPYPNGCHFSYDVLTDRVTVFLEETYEVLLSPEISKYLGFSSHLPIRKSSRAEFKPDPLLGMSHIFIYSDIVQPQIVGDSMVPLLRMINITGADGDIITQTFKPYYLPISKLDFDTIEILLCNEFGEELSFDRGSCIVTLHFKKEK
jgi:hypothetical protein